MLPNLIVIGAGKCGTTSLWHYLRAHPEIDTPPRKELRFFDEFWDRGVDWYEAQFEGLTAPVLAEATPQYARYPQWPEMPKRMRTLIPDARLVYLVRDPIERVVSTWIDEYAAGRENRPFAEAVGVRALDNTYVNDSRYALQLERYLSHFPVDQVHVVASDALRHHRRPTLSALFEFAGVDPSFDSPRFDLVRHVSSEKRRVVGLPRWMPRDVKPRDRPDRRPRLSWDRRKKIKQALYWPFLRPVERPVVDGDLRDALVEILKPDADRLRELLGRPLADWSI